MTRRVLSARANGSLGGKQSSRNMSESQREQRARIAGTATLDTYGRDFYTFIGKQAAKAPHNPRKVIQEPVRLSNSARRIALM
jgi:hypothetical protein